MALSEDQRRSFDARAAVVNRTHRIVRARASAIQERKRTVRNLVLPFVICSALLVLIANAIWSIGDDALAAEIEGSTVWHRIMEFGADAGNNISILLVWFLPISVLTAAIILYRRNRNHRDREERR
jgi:hypothetical protein